MIDNISGTQIELQFPAWRPGRYELGNFAKNIKSFKVFDANGNPLAFKKIKKDAWLVETCGANSIRVDYNYYAFELNAGSTFLDESQLYVNPVNCFIYVKDRVEEVCMVELNVPDNYQIASGLPFKGNTLMVKSYHQLVDNPFIASPSMQHYQFTCRDVDFHLWFQGECKIDWATVQRDFKAYTKAQIDAFGEFPVNEYHYLFQITTTPSYHGVEHMNSTVIQLGPCYELMNARYPDFLGVSSHELYHAWNIKSIRPSEMLPYDYSHENYTKMGYVAEGVTTYLGDLFLFQSGVFSVDQYEKELSIQFQRHLSNPGRLNLSVADSSFDTWLDGYVAGVPGRKTSIYVEGCLLAFIMDIKIMQATANQKSIHHVMHELYHRYAKEGLPYTEEIYKSVCEEISGLDLTDYFNELVNGTATYEGELLEALDYVGFELIKSENELISQRKHGMMLSGNKIVKIESGSPAEMIGLSLDDELVAINGVAINLNADQWFEYFKEDTLEIQCIRQGQFIHKRMSQVDLNFMNQYNVKKIETPNKPQREAFNKWSGKKK